MSSTSTRTEALVARSYALSGHDVLDHFSNDGCVWLGAGVSFVTTAIAQRVALEDAATVLAAIDHRVTYPCSDQAGPRAIGALPFDPAFDGPGQLVIPARIVGRDAHGALWCTEIGAITEPEPTSERRPAQFSVSARTSHAEWCSMVERALEHIVNGDLEKVVLARSVAVDADAPFNLRSILAYLQRSQPGCVVYADRGFVGASPELLVRKRAGRVTARPLAGTGTSPDALLHSAKDAAEHRFVVEAVTAALLRCGATVSAEGPAALALPGVSHLATSITADLTNPDIDVAALVNALHPTPAVGGTPRPAALKAIAALEPFGRGRYAGPCGWVDARGDGEFIVALRGAEIEGSHALLHAGAGIVAGSDPDAEWAETQQKLTPMLQALVRP
jgi:menaquinone-specific isochorismate synthase